MANLTGDQLAALTAGQPVRQTWTVRAPVLADHSAYTDTVIDDGIWSPNAAPKRRVLKAGRRKFEVWNPHPKSTAAPKAVRYSIEVDNSDGLFHRRSGSVWNPFGLYDAAPAECFLLHNLSVLLLSGAWSAISHMAFIGQVINVAYEGSAGMNRTETTPGVTVPTVAPRAATITSEQVGAWAILRETFDKSHAVETSSIFTFAVGGTALTTTSISPTSKAAGSATFTLTVNGTGFSSTKPASILLDGVVMNTSYVSSTQVTCTVPAAYVAVAGTREIRAFRDGPAGSTSNAQTLTVT